MGQERGVDIASEAERFVWVSRVHDETNVVGIGVVKYHIQQAFIIGDCR